MYKFLRNILFLFDPEDVHYFSMNCLRILVRIPFINKMIIDRFATTGVEVSALGLEFRNAVGLAAGFDKNAKYLSELESLGFGFVEIGTVTPQPQIGNEKPRLFRVPKDLALINRMGFNNDGVIKISERLKAWKKLRSESEHLHVREKKMLIGGNIGKNKYTSNEDAWKDYETCFRELFDLVDYFVINVSSPNTPGLRELQDKESLRKILSNLQNINLSKPQPKALLIKISPDLVRKQLDDII